MAEDIQRTGHIVDRSVRHLPKPGVGILERSSFKLLKLQESAVGTPMFGKWSRRTSRLSGRHTVFGEEAESETSRRMIPCFISAFFAIRRSRWGI